MEFKERPQQKYCIHCTLPLEYCYKTEKCLEFWKEFNPEAAVEELSQEYKKPKKIKTETLKAGGKITATITSRSKKKHVTTITGLEEHDIDMKAFAKKLAKQFACACSANATEIVVQGDLFYEIEDLLKEALNAEIDVEIIKKK